MEVWQTSNLRPLRLGDEGKKERRKNKRQDENTLGSALLYRATIIKQPNRRRLLQHGAAAWQMMINRLTNTILFVCLEMSSVVFSHWHPLREETTSFTKPEVGLHNILHCRQGRTDPRPQSTRNTCRKFREVWHVVFETWERTNKHTDPHSDRLIAILRTFPTYSWTAVIGRVTGTMARRQLPRLKCADNGKGQIPLRYLVADRFEASSKLVADLQRAEIWPIS